MNKLIIALGLTLATATGAFADSSALDAFVPQAPSTSTIDYTATASVGDVANDQIVYNRAGNDGSPTFVAPQGNVDYTATASIGGGVSNEQVTYNRADNDGSPTFVR
ncbi:hypothetical protein IMCC20628_03416 [Hoeflea sp. IMCC20628]|uniref:hypothetical protein n=1 Tax=Hoeflea sp. IMCC20628 TaxID=1620421 RepID=UPI00063A9480|nr:hypothetical protein [Hoeflea sp. IMCC20628]AKI00681.1 hypothetical protein IMCC20628_01976 [Hoeflea sp. IMCC20628]AKI02105.1 hypothetical protein IMCC20628_03416 [Hoeflea sp. IMCC20628]